jgi:hypothetical protein
MLGFGIVRRPDSVRILGMTPDLGRSESTLTGLDPKNASLKAHLLGRLLVRPRIIHMFSFARFVKLLTGASEAATLAFLALLWIDPLVGLLHGPEIPQRVIDVGSNFGFLAIMLLLASNLCLLLTRQPRAAFSALRAVVYIVVFMISPQRLGAPVSRPPQGPNQAMHPTAGSCTASLSMTKTRSFQANLGSASGS